MKLCNFDFKKIEKLFEENKEIFLEFDIQEHIKQFLELLLQLLIYKSFLRIIILKIKIFNTERNIYILNFWVLVY